MSFPTSESSKIMLKNMKEEKLEPKMPEERIDANGDYDD